MELNVQHVKPYSDIHDITRISPGALHNIVKLAPGLCHANSLEVKVNGEAIESSKYIGLLPSSEFRVRYGLDSISAVMILDNNLSGSIEVVVRPIGGPYQNVELSQVPAIGTMEDYYGHSLEEFGSIAGIESFGRNYDSIPSRGTDIGGALVGRTSYPGAPDTRGSGYLDERVAQLEEQLVHPENEVPVILYNGRPLRVVKRNSPQIQLQCEYPKLTWHYTPSKSKLKVELHPISGEILSVDPDVVTGVYQISVYVMSNGIRGKDTDIYLSITS